MIPDRVTSDLALTAAALPGMSDDELGALEVHAGETFAAYTLHAKLPRELQGDTRQSSQRIRAQRAAAAESLWLAIQTERARRRAQEAPTV